jgi:iron complex outermembrane receptor protein
MKKRLLAAWCFFWMGALHGAARAALEDVTELSLEELAQVDVTTVSKKSQKLADAAAAVYVITHEEIRRSGATSIPDALRLAPGLSVARISSNSWAISSRGFNGRFANKLRVLIDGRSVYTPTFSGVYWEAQDTRLEDVERIEVIRGPGATLWGSNAVNGIVNVITRNAKQTRGGEFSFGGGTYEKRFGSLRYGAPLGEDTFGRAYVKGFARGAFDTLDGRGAHDGWDSVRGGFRVDGEGTDGNAWTVQGDAYQGDLGEGLLLPSLTPPYAACTTGRAPMSGFNLLGRWKKALSTTSELSFQGYYDHTYRNDPFLAEQRDTLDLDFQHRFAWLDDHDIVWGLYYRWTRPEYSQHFPVHGMADRVFNLYSAFVQDDITLSPNRLKLTIGAKLEHNDYTGFEGQPNIRLLWTPNRQHSLWGAVSRAVRIPSVVEESASMGLRTIPPGTWLNPTPLPAIADVRGNGRFRAEVLWAYELGYRFMPRTNFSTDIALFYNVYDNLRANRALPPALAADGPYIQATFPFTNEASGETYGVELAADWRPYPWWQLQLNYTYLRMNLRDKAGADVVQGAVAVEGASPRQQVSLRSGFNPLPDVDLDFWLRYVDRLPCSGYPRAGFTTYIPAYVALDARLAWRPWPSVELSLVGQNLLDSKHPEIAQETLAPPVSEVPRSVYAKIDWRF